MIAYLISLYCFGSILCALIFIAVRRPTVVEFWLSVIATMICAFILFIASPAILVSPSISLHAPEDGVLGSALSLLDKAIEWAPVLLWVAYLAVLAFVSRRRGPVAQTYGVDADRVGSQA